MAMASSSCRIGGWNVVGGLNRGRELPGFAGVKGCRGVGTSSFGAIRGLSGDCRNVDADLVIRNRSTEPSGHRLWQHVSSRSRAPWSASLVQLWNGSFKRLHEAEPAHCQLLRNLNSSLSWQEVATSDLQSHDVEIRELGNRLPAFVMSLAAFIFYPDTASANELHPLNPAYGEVGALLEAGVQVIYLGALIILLGVGSFLVVRQVLIRRQLESAAKDLQDRVRSGQASSLEYFELGAVMLRKKYFQLANKYLMEAIKKWDGSEQDLAQVYNALGFSYFSDGKVEKAIDQYETAVKLQPGYVTAWNNLADAYETQKEFVRALKAYEEALQFDPKNKIAMARRQSMKEKVDRYQGIP